MTDMLDITARLLARRAGRAVRIRDTSGLESDPDPVFGIAPIRLVGEQQIQAVAFGALGDAPKVAARWNPLNRELDRLAPLAYELNQYLMTAISAGRLPRIWLPHRAALDVLDLLGHRLRRNVNATVELRRLGAQCYALALEATFPGQQVVVVASELLNMHVVTGQLPIEDHHLGSLLAWINPPVGCDVMVEAHDRSLRPAAAMLPKDVDEQVEELRSIGKGDGPEAAAARARIEALLTEGAKHEWNLLIEAHAAFWSLGLPQVAGINKLVTSSFKRVQRTFRNDVSAPSRPKSLIRRLTDLEIAARIVEDIAVHGDAKVRERLRAGGRVIRGRVVAVEQPRPNFRPCTVILRVAQPVTRLRSGTPLQTLDAQVQGRVDRIADDQDSGGVRIALSLTKGVRQTTHLSVGNEEDWVDTVVWDDQFARSRMLSAMDAAQSPFVSEAVLPANVRRQVPLDDLSKVSEQLRKHGK